jgi:hypothetical protein
MIPRNIKIATLILAGPLILGIAGLFLPLIDQALRDHLGTHSGRLINTYAVVLYGLFVGSYWGFIAIKEPQNFTPYLLALTPALVILLIYSVGSTYRSFALIICLLLLIPIDWYFTKNMLAPTWWMRFRIPLTGFVILCLFTRRFISFILATLALT